MNMKRKSLLLKIMLFIGLPVAIAFCVVAVVSLITVNQSVTTLSTSELNAKSEAVSKEIGGIFSNYEEMAVQMAANTQFQALYTNTVPGVGITAAPGFAEAKNTLINVKATNSDNIILWQHGWQI